MKFLKKIECFIRDPKFRFQYLDSLGFYNNLDDLKYLQKKFLYLIGHNLDIDYPKSYNEKLQWIKLYDRKPIYTKMVDKFEAKKIVEEKIGAEYVIPTLGVWEKFDEIDFEKLPKRFVLKCTHDSGGVIVVDDKNKIDWMKIKEQFERKLSKNFYFYGREWPYRNVKPRIIAEKRLEMSSNNDSDIVNDYKVYTFNGKARICMINTERGIHTTADYFDKNFNKLDFSWGYPHSMRKIERPQNYDLMFQLAEKLAENTLELRVDFYEVSGQLFFGEMTFFDGSGFDKIEPFEWDLKLGDWIELPNSKSKEVNN